MDALAQKFNELTQIPTAELRPQLMHYSDYDNYARKEYKYSIGNRRSGANPTVYVNGAKVDGGASMNYEDWKKLVDGLIK